MTEGREDVPEGALEDGKVDGIDLVLMWLEGGITNFIASMTVLPLSEYPGLRLPF